ncbi:MAG: carboxylating nicotinate-nucleotide diphosphorylase [Armatimonadetes bacterium]|nr:carboxylating nicotinate-nucleotide diphosphorylase [Armatimonadota bacterium]
MNAVVHDIVARALAEDIGPGDVTSELAIPATAQARGVFLAKQPGVLSGLDVAEECFRQVDTTVEFRALVAEGEPFADGAHLAEVTGPARALLSAERVALNFLQRLCGVATLTREFVDRVAGTRARIVDTRKTTPGLRVLEKRAVRAGGGYNHRFALYDGVLLKDNHIAVGGGVTAAVAAARAGAPHTLKIEVEVTSLQQLTEALAAGADVALLDNMSLEQVEEAVAFAVGRVVLEASGGINLDNVAAVAGTGVDLISIGALTHSAKAVDISLELELES